MLQNSLEMFLEAWGKHLRFGAVNILDRQKGSFVTSQEADHPNKQLSAQTGSLLDFEYVWTVVSECSYIIVGGATLGRYQCPL